MVVCRLHGRVIWLGWRCLSKDCSQASVESKALVSRSMWVRARVRREVCKSGVGFRTERCARQQDFAATPLCLLFTMSANEYVALKSQVGGHPGVMSSQDGSLIIKPCLPEELAFYQEIASKPALAPLRSLVPKFYGTLKLQGQIKKPEGTSEAVELVPVAPEEQQKDQCAIVAIHRLLSV